VPVVHGQHQAVAEQHRPVVDVAHRRHLSFETSRTGVR
jgi:hypothetical protein